MYGRDPRRRRPGSRRGRAPRVPTRPPQRLIRANALMDKGHFPEAARSFVRLSHAARRHGMPIRGANLAIRASQAYLADGNVEPAMEQIRLAIRILVHRGRSERAGQLLEQATKRLEEKGFQTEADELDAYSHGLREEAQIPLSDWNKPSVPSYTGRHGSLPSRCSACGASLVPDDVTWHDARTAECPYCGTILKTL